MISIGDRYTKTDTDEYKRIYVEQNLRENVVHGTELFPCTIYHTKFGSARKALYFHWHPEMEIIYVKKGRAVFWNNFQDAVLSQGDVMITSGGSVHAAEMADAGSCEFVSVVFDLSMLSSKNMDICQLEYLDPLLQQKQQIDCILHQNDLPWHADVIACAEELIQLLVDQKPFYQMFVKAQLMRMIALCLQNGASASSEQLGIDIQRARSILSYIHAHITEPLDADFLASKLHVSKSYFFKIFRKLTHKTPVEYITQYRMQCAAQLLVNTDTKIIDIAALSGFRNLSYFNRVFKQYFQRTPQQYRQKYKKLVVKEP